MVRNHNSSKMADGYDAARRTTYRSLFQVYRPALQAQQHLHLKHQYRRKQHLLQCIPHQQEVRERVAEYGETCRKKQQKPKTQMKMETTRQFAETRCVTCQNGYKKFTENIVDENVPAHRDAPSSPSRESASEPGGKKKVSAKHSIYTHFPKVRNCDICMRTELTRVPCRKRTGAAIPRAENFGGSLTADHKVLSEGCESRNNHRDAVVVQDLATHWIQSYPCKTKTSQVTEKSLLKFLEPTPWKPKVIYTHNTLEFGQSL